MALQKEKVIADIEAGVVLDEGLLTPDAQRKIVEDSTKTAVKEYGRKFEELVKQAKGAAKTATGLGDLVDSLTDTGEEGWCSHCLAKTQHQKASGKSLYVCSSCGTATVKCSAIGCDHFAVADLRPVPVPVFCAEHTHHVPDFERIDHRIDDLTQWRELREFKAMHVARAAKLSATAVATLAIGASGGLVLAPMVGSAIGTTVLGLSGAAATNAGLAALGFGSLAAGGLGKAGGSMVVAAAGGLLGSAFGVQALNSYLGEDNSFDIRRVRKGDGTPVLIARGFTTEKDPDWRKEVKAVESAYPNSPIYLVEWGSKERRELVSFLSPGAGAAGGAALKGVVKRASKKIARRANPAGLALGVVDLVANPWHTAVNRANKTALALAAILQRTDLESVVLIGHSLGGRVMLNLATALAGTSDAEQQVRVEAVHLLGAAIGPDPQRDQYGEHFAGVIHNYHSSKDNVLGVLYPAAMLGSKPIGFKGAEAPFIENHDVSDVVQSHSDYYEKVELVGSSPAAGV